MYLLIGLACVADDYGRFWFNAASIKSGVFPTKPDVSLDWINETVSKFINSGFLCVYEVDGIKYAHFPCWFQKGWFLKQRLDHPREFANPDCPSCQTEDITRNKRETSRTIKYNSIKSNKIEEKRNKDNLTEQELRKLLFSPSLKAELLSRYHLITPDVYDDKCNSYINWVKNHRTNDRDHERELEGRLMGEQDRLEKEEGDGQVSRSLRAAPD